MAAPSARTVVVVAGGAPFDARTALRLRSLEPDALTVAADSGVDVARALGRRVDVAVGDFDSISLDGLAWLNEVGATIERHPAAKDATDLELALDAAMAHGPERVVVVGGHGGRLDHLLGNVALLTAPRYAPVALVAHLGPATVTVVRERVELLGRPGDVVSLLPQHGPVTGVVTEGLAYPLRDEPLAAGSTRGVSNVFVDPVAVVRCSSGVLVAIQPGSLEPLHLPPAPPIQE